MGQLAIGMADSEPSKAHSTLAAEKALQQQARQGGSWHCLICAPHTLLRHKENRALPSGFLQRMQTIAPVMSNNARALASLRAPPG